MNSFNLSPEEWQKFCEVMLRQHYGQQYFWPVPDTDRGDCGIEFFTTCGKLYQCYCPENNINIAEYKKRVQSKITKDLKKLKTYELMIGKMLDSIKINQWILLTPENKSKDLIVHCHKKKNEVILKNLPFIDNNNFSVKLETAESYPAAQLFAKSVQPKPVNITIPNISELATSTWLQGNVKFSSNIERKSIKLMGAGAEQFKRRVVSKYIQIESFTDKLRQEYPDLYNLIEDTARAQLAEMRDIAAFEESHNREFVEKVRDMNKSAFAKHASFFCDENLQSLDFGYLSKWITECYMDFE